MTLADVRGPTLNIVCEPCGRRGRYNVQRLIAAHGHAEARPDVVRLAKALVRKKPEGGRLSLRAISAELAACGVLNERRRPFNPKSVAAMLGVAYSARP